MTTFDPAVPSGSDRAENAPATVAGVQHGPLTAAGSPQPPAAIKTVPMAEAPAGSGLIKTVSPALMKAKAARKGFSAPVGKRVQATYPIQKPPKSKFVRVHPSPDYHLVGVLTLEDAETGEIYYVDPDLELPEFIGRQTHVTDLYAAQMHDESLFIWFVNLSATSWYRAAKQAVATAARQ